MSAPKTEVLTINPEDDDPPIEIDGKPLAIKEKCKYLGTVFDTKGLWVAQTEAALGKLQKAIQRWRPVFTNSRLRISTRMRIYEVCVRPIVTYGAEVWWQRDSDKGLKALEAGEAAALRMIFGVCSRTSTAGLILESGLIPLREALWRCMLVYAGRLERISERTPDRPGRDGIPTGPWKEPEER